jgi:hypothetical protein
MLSPNALKIIAVICMVLDHSILVFGPEMFQSTYYQFIPGLLHCVGRISAPIFFYFIPQGYMYTKNANLYTLRLLLFAILSYIPYMAYRFNLIFDYKHLHCQNILFTLFFGLIFIRIIHEVKNKVLKTFFLVAVGFFISFCEYGLYGAAYIFVFNYYKNQHDKKACIAGIVGILLVYLHRYINFTKYTFSNIFNSFFSSENLMSILQSLFLFIPIFLISRCDYTLCKKPSKFLKWFFYLFYPAHILLLLLFRIYIIGIPLR